MLVPATRRNGVAELSHTPTRGAGLYIPLAPTGSCDPIGVSLIIRFVSTHNTIIIDQLQK